MIRIGHLVVGAIWGYFVGALLAGSLIFIFGSWWIRGGDQTLFALGLALGWALAIFIGYRTGLAAERRMLSGKRRAVFHEWIIVASAAVLGAVASIALNAAFYVVSHVL